MTAPAAPVRHAAVVYNPTKVELPALRDAVARAESEAGWAKSRWLETSAEDRGPARRGPPSRTAPPWSSRRAATAPCGRSPKGCTTRVCRSL
ncbi:MAG: hypothetical protein R2717_01220 [Schumannella sp.]